MKVAEAKSIARAWVLDHAGSVPGLWAMFFGGSINWLPDDAELGAGSDVEGLLASCIPAYDRAVQIHRTHFYPDFDLDPAARHVIARMALLLDAPEEYQRDYAAPFEELRAALGIDTAVAIARKADMAEAMLTQVMLLAESIWDEAGRDVSDEVEEVRQGELDGLRHRLRRRALSSCGWQPALRARGSPL